MVEAFVDLGPSAAALVALGQLLLLAVVAVAGVLLVRELRRLRQCVFVFDNSVHERLRAVQIQLDRGSPARYALASFIAAQRGSSRSTADLRQEFEAMVTDLDRLEAAVEDVLRGLEGSADAGRDNGVGPAGPQGARADGQKPVAHGQGRYGDAA